MNEFLAEIYNTRESIGAPQDNSDVEKLAEAQLLDEALSAEGIDIDKLAGDTILKVARQLFGDDSALVKSADAESPAEEKKEEKGETKEEEKKEEEKKASEETMEEKVAQADFLGRVMAHSFYNEKTDIEKNAAMPAALKSGLEAAGRFGRSVGEKAKEFGAKAKDTGKKGLDFAKAHKGHAAVGATGVAAGGAAGFLAGKKKKASAIDILAEKRAMEWASAHGLVQSEPTESTDEAKLASAVDQRAVELLTEAGIDINAVEAAAQK